VTFISSLWDFSAVAVRLAVPDRGPLLGHGAAPERGALALPERALLHHLAV